jgi:hypothetical protein
MVTFVPWDTVAGVATHVIAGLALMAGLGLMVIWTGADAVAAVESETRSEGVVEPAVVGVPERMPAADRVRPDGRPPVGTLQA